MAGWLMMAWMACKPDPGSHDAAGDADTDSDADSDADTDTDSDPDSRVFDADHVLVVPNGDGLMLMNRDGSVAFGALWSTLVGPCGECGGEGSSADGDGLLLSFTTQGPNSVGDIVRIDGTGGLEFRRDGFQFPHDAVRDPVDGTILVPEPTANRIRWVAGDGSSADPVRQLDDNDPDWPDNLPNGVDRFDYGGRSLLVSSHRGTGGSFDGTGEITLWDITEAAAPALLWTFPSDGSLRTPHGCQLRRYGGQWWLIYAHSEGGDGTSTVGLAVSSDPTVLPAYVADLVPVDPVGPFGFLRGVELTSDGDLWLTDSGGGGGVGPPKGRIVVAPLPDLAPTGATGGVNGGQVFVDLDGAAVVKDGLANPFEGWLWAPPTPWW